MMRLRIKGWKAALLLLAIGLLLGFCVGRVLAQGPGDAEFSKDIRCLKTLAMIICGIIALTVVVGLVAAVRKHDG